MTNDRGDASPSTRALHATTAASATLGGAACITLAALGYGGRWLYALGVLYLLCAVSAPLWLRWVCAR